MLRSHAGTEAIRSGCQSVPTRTELGVETRSNQKISFSLVPSLVFLHEETVFLGIWIICY